MEPTKDWPHAPIHRLDSAGVFMVTGATLHKQHFFHTERHLTLLEGELLSLAKRYEWLLEAWAVFVNHYHFIARSYPSSAPLDQFIKQVHSKSARQLNQWDSEGREIWYNFWDTKLTFERSYPTRLNYVHQNPVKHGIVNVANQYAWPSARWFERTASPASIKTIYSFKTEKVKIADDY